jgi:transposase
MARVEVITGRERRRRWTEDQKRAIVAESFAPGAMVSDIARRTDISSGQIYRWRQELRATHRIPHKLNLSPGVDQWQNG